MILMPQIFDVTTNENARYKRNELEYYFLFGVDGELPNSFKKTDLSNLWKLGDNTFVIEWFAGINCIILWSQI